MNIQLPPDVRQKLMAEFKFASGKMREAQEPVRKLYFFSALFNEISRQLNWHWNQHLVLMHMVMQTAHAQLTSRLQQTPAATLMPAITNALTDVADDLTSYVEKNGEGMDLSDILGRIAVLTYASTPHGTYVAEKGLLTLDRPT